MHQIQYAPIALWNLDQTRNTPEIKVGIVKIFIVKSAIFFFNSAKPSVNNMSEVMTLDLTPRSSDFFLTLYIFLILYREILGSL